MRILTAAGLVIISGVARVQAADKPNIIVILADDLGYGDVQCYNPQRSKIRTPCIDRLATQGMRFMDAHSSSGVCSPSRYSLLTGRYHWRTRLQAGIVNPFGAPLIAPARLTIGGLAKQHGYRTACIGKWHLGWDWPLTPAQRRLMQAGKGQDDEAPPSDEHLAAWREVFGKPIPGGPTARGFDEYFGTDVPNWPPYCFIENDRTVGVPSEFLPKNLLGGTPLLASQGGPSLKGWNLEAILPALGDRACEFISRQAKESAPFLLYMPLTAPHEPIAITADWKGKSGLHDYADFVMETDAVVGRVLDALEKSGAADHTLVIFTSDNGKAAYTGAADLEKKGHCSSGPYRGYKSDAWEGGHREPLVVRWPGVVKPGSVCDQLVQQTDLMATFAEIFGTKLPDQAGEDSFSFLPLLRGGDQPIRTTAVNCSLNGVPSVRSGAWKLILAPGSGGWSPGNTGQPVQLYNLADDPGEKNNLAAKDPERIAGMKTVLEKLITNGRSTPGAPQKNDVEVRRYPQQPALPGKNPKAGK